ncbi:UDP-N-acetyl-D-mannosamine dehydrogenase [Corynebacterium coyleae]|uniref:UDP-N-acetyl-D-mannosamine dehydrogenase n=1 Tax=Corynebacterium coyleae TaxID=53374 RepID=UPI0015E120BB|nr:UDP-N-acetyl-D-mannosamine dehydrogenase [Corynebacterium coyleae]
MPINPTQPYDVAVIGLGYIGLPTAAFFASAGLNVYGVDISTSRVNSIARGEAPFAEPGFASLLDTVIDSGLLKVGDTLRNAGAFIIAVPTPLNADNGANTSFVYTATESIAPLLQGGELIILESTCPPGLTEEIAEFIVERRPDLTLAPNKTNSIYVAHAPERVLPGKIMAEMKSNDRIIGGVTPEAAARVRELYKSFCTGEVRITDSRTAEMTKLAENSFRDVNIAFANELSMICDELDIDVWELISLANRHPRVNILQPGPGVGGHCIAIDPWFIVSSVEPETARLISTGRQVNNSKPYYAINQVKHLAESSGVPENQLKICLLGITFKADIDDLRESPALLVAEKIAEAFPDAQLCVVEPNLDELPPSLKKKGAQKVSLEDGIDGATVTAVLVDHTEFKTSRSKIQTVPRLVDLRGLTSGDQKLG